jgi:hypothetical protein
MERTLLSDVIGPYVNELLVLGGFDELTGRARSVRRASFTTKLTGAMRSSPRVELVKVNGRYRVDDSDEAGDVAESYVSGLRPKPPVEETQVGTSGTPGELSYDQWVEEFSDEAHALYLRGERDYVAMETEMDFNLGFAMRRVTSGGLNSDFVRSMDRYRDEGPEAAYKHLVIAIMLKSLGIKDAFPVTSKVKSEPSFAQRHRLRQLRSDR